MPWVKVRVTSRKLAGAYYAELGQPREAEVFIARLQDAMQTGLEMLDRGLPRNPSVTITPRGRIVVSPLSALPEPVHLVGLKGELFERWPMTSLLDILKRPTCGWGSRRTSPA